MAAAKPGLERSFGAQAASRISGVPYSTLDFWARSGILEPSIAVAKGTGSDRMYSLTDLYALRALAGCPIKTAKIQRMIVEEIRRAPPCAHGVFVELNDVVELAIDLETIMREVNEKAGKT